jgi:hypothetical protein
MTAAIEACESLRERKSEAFDAGCWPSDLPAVTAGDLAEAMSASALFHLDRACALHAARDFPEPAKASPTHFLDIALPARHVLVTYLINFYVNLSCDSFGLVTD